MANANRETISNLEDEAMSVAMVWLPEIEVFFNLAHVMSVDQGINTATGKRALGVRMPTGHTLNLLSERDQVILLEACALHAIGGREHFPKSFASEPQVKNETNN